ncbi:unnamed protein product [Toxocara canis]|uniref:ADAM_CR_2 domain-containing protein n=1 Tax=Toxocara canis TaxID=6265 RepID=A0A183V0L0_TOXCA|nr:unnamed protein product [Toxocara canis]
MRHDEPYCPSKHIMSSSLGPGKVTWSTCSLRDYHTFLQRLDSRGKNCLRVSNLPQMLTVRSDVKPGQIYDADTQCRMMHGPSYQQVTPRQDHYDGICYMMWCGQTTFGRIITSHPALEGTFCGPSKWCELGRCVPWPGTQALPKHQLPVRVDGQWSGWGGASCSSCSCPSLVGAIGVTVEVRTCSNPYPSNGGLECVGATSRALVCSRRCSGQMKTVDQYISEKCSEHKQLKNDRELTGTGSQLNRYPQRACKVFCDVSIMYGSQRNYRFFGDNLPNGAPCGNGRYCLDGECLALSCNDNALVTRDVPCPTDQCPLHTVSSSSRSGEWTVWSSWSFCSQTCGSGFRERSRTCNNGQCDGQATERVSCSSSACPAWRTSSDTWSDWTPWNQCSVTCGKGSQARYRRCISSQNSLGYSCGGSSMEVRQCDMGSCNTGIVGLWGKWTEWSHCSTSCGPGIQTRNRYCTKEPCDGSGQSRMSCNLGACATTSQWLQWGAWSECSQLCGRGLRSRTRKCSDGNCFGGSVEQQFCNEQPCHSSNGQWSGWSSWGSCSVTCGSGVKRRTRHCQYGNCPGSHRDSTMCNQGSCGEWDATWGGKHNSTNTTTPDTTSSSRTPSENTQTTASTTINTLSHSFRTSTVASTAETSKSSTSSSSSISSISTISASSPGSAAGKRILLQTTFSAYSSSSETTITLHTRLSTTAPSVVVTAAITERPPPTTSATKRQPSVVGNKFASRKKTIRRFWLFDNGTLSRTHEIDPVLLETLVRQSGHEKSASAVGVIGRHVRRRAETESANGSGSAMAQVSAEATNMNARPAAYGIAKEAYMT